MNTKQSRIRRARKTRAKIAAVKAIRLAIHRTNSHIYAQIISADGGRAVVSASSNDKDVRTGLANGGNADAASVVGKRLAEKAKSLVAPGVVVVDDLEKAGYPLALAASGRDEVFVGRIRVGIEHG